MCLIQAIADVRPRQRERLKMPQCGPASVRDKPNYHIAKLAAVGAQQAFSARHLEPRLFWSTRPKFSLAGIWPVGLDHDIPRCRVHAHAESFGVAIYAEGERHVIKSLRAAVL